MSDATAGGARHEEHGTVRQEQDRVPALPVVLLILASLALIALGVVWPWMILSGSATPRPLPRFGVAPRVIQPQPRIVGGTPASGIEERAFESSAQRPWSATPAQGSGRYPRTTDPLAGFDWADRERGTVELPIDVAVELWLERHGAERAGAGTLDRGAAPQTGDGAPGNARTGSRP